MRTWAATAISMIRTIGLKSIGPVAGKMRRMGASSGSTTLSRASRTGCPGARIQDAITQTKTRIVKHVGDDVDQLGQ